MGCPGRKEEQEASFIRVLHLGLAKEIKTVRMRSSEPYSRCIDTRTNERCTPPLCRHSRRYSGKKLILALADRLVWNDGLERNIRGEIRLETLSEPDELALDQALKPYCEEKDFQIRQAAMAIRNSLGSQEDLA